MNNLTISFLAVLAGFICRCYLRSIKTRSPFPFPPGPKPKPLVGNALDIPTQTPWLTYSKWADIYESDILHAEALGQHIIILNSLEDAIELLEKKASNYSGRPTLPMLELMDWVNFNTALIPHGDLWRRHRRVFQQSFRKDATVLYEPIGIEKVHKMLKSLLETPNDFRTHIRTVAAAIIMAIVYGHDVSTMNDKYVRIVEEAIDGAVAAILPGATLVNTIPMLRYIPSWFPGAKFHQVAVKIKGLTYQMQNTTFDLVRKNMRDGTGRPSLLGSLLEANDANGGSVEYENILKGVSATAYAAGADTTVASIAAFFHAMATNPDVQLKAQNEIDAVIGNERLPETGDRASLPYVEALYREVLRWRPAFPLGVPHTSSGDDIYKGFLIPKGSIILANIWAMSHNENVHKNPDQFQPERHLNDHGQLNQDDGIVAFGFGKRVCAGRHLADTTVWLVIVSVLATLNIAKAKDSKGVDIEIAGDYTDAIISHPQPFPCSITPRSSKSRELIISDE